MARRSIGFPVTLASVLIVLALSLAVAWQIVVVSDVGSVARGLEPIQWVLIVLGGVFFTLLIVGLVGLSAWLVREMRVNQRQQAFLDAVTHEMKTPLASMRLYVDTLERHDPDAERRREFLGHMNEDLDRLTETVEQVLTAARAEVRSQPQRESVPLRPLLEASIHEIRSRHRLEADAIRLEASGTAAVWGDAHELGLVFRNLLENAVKYSAGATEVRVSIRPDGEGRTAVDITDRGIGIPPKELRKIFQRFYRAGRDMQRTAGLGLGLFIVRNLVRRHGGRVYATSEGSGQGSRFRVTLRTAPLTATAPAASATGLGVHVEDPAG